MRLRTAPAAFILMGVLCWSTAAVADNQTKHDDGPRPQDTTGPTLQGRAYQQNEPLGESSDLVDLPMIAARDSKPRTRTYMSCDGRWNLNSAGEPELDYASIKWRQRPKSCVLDTNGYTYGVIHLEGLRWSSWGKRAAKATGFQVSNHYNPDGSLPKSPVKVALEGRRIGCGPVKPGTYFYSRMTVEEEGRSGTVPLFLPSWRC